MAEETGIGALFKGTSVVRRSGEAVSVITVLKDKTVLLYFAASWAEPCIHFTPLLAKFYDMVRAVDDSIVIIFVSRDRSAKEQSAFFNDGGMHAEWLMAARSDEPGDIMTALNVENIPSLVLVGRDGRGVVKNAQEQLSDLLEDRQGRLIDPDEARPAVAAKWDEWRRLAMAWRSPGGQATQGGSSSSSSRGACGAVGDSLRKVPGAHLDPGIARSDREALRAERLASLGGALAGADYGVSAFGGASSSSAPSHYAPGAPSEASPSSSGAVRILTLAEASLEPRGLVGRGGGGSGAAGSASQGPAGAHVEVPWPLEALYVSPAASAGVPSDMASDATESIRGGPEGGPDVDMDEALEQLTSAGIPHDLARETLEATGWNVPEAFGRLFDD